MSTAPERMDDRRAALVAAALVGAVVLVLGFGSGFWSELAERTAGSSPASAGRNLGTVVQDDGSVALGVTRGSSGSSAGASGSSTAPRHVVTPTHVGAAVATTPPAHTADPSTTTPSTTATTVPAAAPPVATCASGTVAPFWAHFQAAHLETSPGQQVADALDLDQYVQTHTVLVEDMLTPVVEAVIGDGDGPGAFWAHFQAAHLETSPGQQVADALDLDQYVLTHTVLVEDMLDPIVGTC